MRPSSPVPILLGMAVTLAGVLAIVVAWARSAGFDVVTEQVPYLIGGGLVGLALVMVGLTLVVVQSRRVEGVQQAEQVHQVAAAIAALREVLAPTDDDALSLRRSDEA